MIRFKQPVDTSTAYKLALAKYYFDYSQYDSAWAIYKSLPQNEMDTNALINIGDLYYFGRATSQNYDQAKIYYEAAITAGSTEGINNIGVLYERGHGVVQNYSQAKIWYEKAAAAGNADGMSDLGYLYLNGLWSSKECNQSKILV
jgi:TPR repeat protein